MSFPQTGRSILHIFSIALLFVLLSFLTTGVLYAANEGARENNTRILTLAKEAEECFFNQVASKAKDFPSINTT